MTPYLGNVQVPGIVLSVIIYLFNLIVLTIIGH